MRRLALLGTLAIAGLALACNGGEEDLGTTTPGPSSGRTPAALLTMTPTPAATQPPLSPAQPVPLEQGASVTDWGVYLVETATGGLWRLGEQGGAWSPDGKTLVAAGCCVGKGGLDLIDITTGQTTRFYSGDVHGAAWSPDGAQIAFSPAGGNLPPGLYMINRDGTGLKQLSETVTTVGEWSPRGDRIAFQDGELYLLDVATGEVRQIPDATEPPWQPWSFSWSPDGLTLAFANGAGLYIYDPDTGDRRQVAAGPSAFPIWSPDGSRIVFGFGPGVPFPHSPEVTIQAPYVVETKGGTEPRPLPMASTMSWSPDGSRIAYLEHGCITGNWDIYTVAADGSSEVRLTTMPEGPKEGPYWSPTGATIAFSTFGELILLDAESGELRTLVVSGWPETAGRDIHLHGPVWSPDGRYIQFTAGTAHGICD